MVSLYNGGIYSKGLKNPYTRRGGVYSRFPNTSTFSPSSIAGLQLWLDGADTATITQAANAVSQWSDKSGLGNHATQAVGANQPLTNTDTINGKNVIKFDGAGDGLILPSSLYSTLPNGDNSVFIVFKSGNSGDASQALMTGQIASTGTRYAAYITTTLFEVQNRNTSNLFTTMNDARDTSVKIAGFLRGGVNISPFVNGIKGTAGTNSENTSALVSLMIGTQVNTVNDRFLGDIAEIIAYNSMLSDSNANLVGNYLKNKWSSTWTGF